MNVITNTCAIFSWIVLAENVEFGSFSNDDFLNKGEKIVGELKRLIS